jgi:LPXTG-motif cell wall-anchored protein
MSAASFRASAAVVALVAGALLTVPGQSLASNHCPQYPPSQGQCGAEPGGPPASPGSGQPSARPSAPGQPTEPGSPGQQPTGRPSPGGPGQHPPRDDAPALDSQDSAAPGGAITVTSAGWASRTPVTLELHSSPVLLGTFQTTASGTLTARVTIPRSTPPGQHTIVAFGLSDTGTFQRLTTPIFITGPGVPGAPAGPGQGAPSAPDGVDGDADGVDGEGAGAGGVAGGPAAPGGSVVTGVGLPRTGRDVVLFLVLGLALVAAGVASMLSGRRRRLA